TSGRMLSQIQSCRTLAITKSSRPMAARKRRGRITARSSGSVNVNSWRAGMGKASKFLRGVVHGKTIELDDPLVDFRDGQSVSVLISSEDSQEDGIRLSAGGWGEDAEGLDEFSDQLRLSRQRGRETESR